MQKGLAWNMNILKLKCDRNPVFNLLEIQIRIKLFEVSSTPGQFDVANAAPVYMHHDIRDLHNFDRFV